MSCKSAIYTVNNTVSAVAINGIIPIGTTIRRFGKNIEQSGNGVLLCGEGYYKCSASITLLPSTVGTVTVSLLADGVAIAGGTASSNVATANTAINLNLESLVRLRCCDDTSTLTLVLTGVNAGITNVAFVVEKI
jgi:hypothetical protein